FPMGVGIVNLSVTHLLPFLSKREYTVLEGIAMLASLVWYWRICKRIPEAAMLLAVLPLFFAWRSLASYFYCAAYPLFILMVARVPLSKKLRSKQTTTPLTVSFLPDRNEGMLPGVPTAASVRA